jgi:hypothetical protein
LPKQRPLVPFVDRTRLCHHSWPRHWVCRFARRGLCRIPFCPKHRQPFFVLRKRAVSGSTMSVSVPSRKVPGESWILPARRVGVSFSPALVVESSNVAYVGANMAITKLSSREFNQNHERGRENGQAGSCFHLQSGTSVSCPAHCRGSEDYQWA